MEAEQQTFWLGPWFVEPFVHRMRQGDCVVDLSPRAMQVLQCLARHHGQVVSKEMLINEVWDGVQVSENALARTIVLLRKALGDAAETPHYIVTVPTKGYRLIMPLRVESAELAQADVPATNVVAKSQPSRPWLRLLVLGVVLLSMALLATSWLYLPNESFPTWTTLTPVTTFDGYVSEPDVDRSARYLVYARAVGDSRHRQIWLRDRLQQQDSEITDGNYRDRHPVFSPSGSRIAFHREYDQGCEILIATLTNEYKLNRIERAANCSASSHYLSLSWSPDERQLYFTDAATDEAPYRIHVLHLTDQMIVPLTPLADSGKGDYVIRMSPSGQHLAVLRNSNTLSTQIVLYELTSQQSRVLFELPTLLRSVQWSADGEGLYVADQNFRLLEYRISEHEPHVRYVSDSRIEWITRSGDDALLLAENQSDIDLWKTSIGDNGEAQRIAPSTRSERLASLSHSQRKLAFVSSRNGLPQLWLDQDGTLQQLTQFDTRKILLHRPQWSSDDRYLAVAASGELWVIDTMKLESQRIPNGGDNVVAPTWHPAAPVVVYSRLVGKQWQLWQWQMPLAQTLHRLTEDGYTAQFSDDGHWIYFSRFFEEGLWRCQVDADCEPERVIDNIANLHWYPWQIIDHQLIYLDQSENGLRVMQRSLGSNQSDILHSLPSVALTDINMATDRQTLYYSRYATRRANIVELKR